VIADQLTRARLVELLASEPDTGRFIWRRSKGRSKAGTVAGVDCNGYTQIGIDRRLYYAHRLAWLFVHGSWPTEQIDHINGLKSDNRIRNLRSVSAEVNNQNRRRARRDCVSGWQGVHLDTETGRFIARIKSAGKLTRLGTYQEPAAAHGAYLIAKRSIHEGCSL
jgi:hypothetical protein